ncbi:MAG: membrane dipeptidase [Planctomycetota bacterium]
MTLFDAHLDLAYLVEIGRDMHAGLADCRGALRPPAVTLPTLAEGSVTQCLATVFTQPFDDGDEPADGGAYAFPRGDSDAAYRAGWRQMLLYKSWHEGDAIDLWKLRPEGETPLSVGILIEGADPVPSPDELGNWSDAGVVAVGLTWAHRGRYADGNSVHLREDRGLTDLGRGMVEAIDGLGLIHDLSHLSQKATEELLERTDKLVVATHSNCRQLFAPDGEAGKLTKSTQRHLSDETVAEIGRRGGVVGLNLCASFLRDGLKRGDRPSIDDCIRHVEHLCEVMGHKDGVGLGTDMDGGFDARHLPEGIDEPRHVHKIVDVLRSRGWSNAELDGFRRKNWERVFGL